MATRRMDDTERGKVWTIAEAKARLSEILRLAESEGPQRIGMRKSFVIVPEEDWLERGPEPQLPMGQWLVENLRGLGPLEIPDRRDEPERPIPYADWTEEESSTWEQRRQ